MNESKYSWRTIWLIRRTPLFNGNLEMVEESKHCGTALYAYIFKIRQHIYTAK